MVYLGDASFVLGIKIHQYHSRGILGLSLKGYIDKGLKRFGIQSCKPLDTPVTKGDKFSLSQCPKGHLEIKLGNEGDSLGFRCRKYNACSSLYTSGYSIHRWNVGQIFKQLKDGSLESSQMGYAIFT